MAVRRWPLAIISLPAVVAIWSGWVSLGRMCGFGLVQPLPGIMNWHLNTAITLPVGLEAYGAFALGAWLAPGGVPEGAKRFAKRSAVGALLLGMLGQVAYHLLSAAHATRAPWPVVVLVGCLPVVTLGFGAALTHLLRDAPKALSTAPEAVTADASPDALSAAPILAFTDASPDAIPDATASASPDALSDASTAVSPDASRTRSNDVPRRRGRHSEPERIFRAELDAGKLPSVRAIQRECKVGRPKAQTIQDRLSDLVAA